MLYRTVYIKQKNQYLKESLQELLNRKRNAIEINILLLIYNPKDNIVPFSLQMNLTVVVKFFHCDFLTNNFPLTLLVVIWIMLELIEINWLLLLSKSNSIHKSNLSLIKDLIFSSLSLISLMIDLLLSQPHFLILDAFLWWLHKCMFMPCQVSWRNLCDVVLVKYV